MQQYCLKIVLKVIATKTYLSLYTQVTTHYVPSNVFYGNSCVNIIDIFKTFAYDTYDVHTQEITKKTDAMLQLDIGTKYEFNNNKKYLFNCLNNVQDLQNTITRSNIT